MPATRSIADLPGPPGLPGLGNAHQLRPSSLHATAEEWCARYGPIFRFDLARRRVVCVGDTQSINAILRERPEGFRRWRELERNADETDMKGVFVAEGDEWRRQRRLAVTALNSNHLNRYFHIVRTSTERLHRRLDAGRPPRRVLRHRPAADLIHRRHHLCAGVRARSQHARAGRQRAAEAHSDGSFT